MWKYVQPMTSDELYHSGVKGMHWYQRLYQNKDGTLTALGKRRAAAMRKKYAKAKDKYTELTGKKRITRDKPVTKQKKQEEANGGETKKKSVSEMTDKELQDKINRLTAEQNYARLISQMNPQTTSRGKKFVDKLIDDSLNSLAKGVGDAVGNAAKNYINKTLGEAIADSLKDDKKKDKKVTTNL